MTTIHGIAYTIKIMLSHKFNFNLASLIGLFKSSYDNVLRWMPQDLNDDKSTLVQVMAWCLQATSHNLNQCWLRSPTPYGVTRPQWVKVQRQPTSHSYYEVLSFVLTSTCSITVKSHEYHGVAYRYLGCLCKRLPGVTITKTRLRITSPLWGQSNNGQWYKKRSHVVISWWDEWSSLESPLPKQYMTGSAAL